MIIIDVGPKSKTNYYDRKQVIYTAGELLRLGAIKCSLCNGALSVHGCYRRQIKDGDGKRQNGWIAQGYCAACKKYPALIPDFVMPYKQYETTVIEAAISTIEEEGHEQSECPADESTIRRWAAQFQKRGAEAAGHLQAIHYHVRGRHISILEMHNRSLLKQLGYLVHAITGKQTGGIIGGANAILTRYNSGFL